MMNTLSPKTTYQNLRNKGFEKPSNKSSDHKYLEFRHNGKHILHTKISHGNKDIGPHLIKQMSVQCKLSKPQFLDLARCPMSKEGYLEILEKEGHLD